MNQCSSVHRLIPVNGCTINQQPVVVVISTSQPTCQQHTKECSAMAIDKNEWLQGRLCCVAVAVTLLGMDDGCKFKVVTCSVPVVIVIVVD